MTLYRIGTPADPRALLQAYGVESGGVAIMADKAETLLIHIGGLKTPAANILKQDALSIGADLAVPGGVITCERPAYDCLLIATPKQLKLLARKERTQPFGLKEVARRLEALVPAAHPSVRIMGVINANDDSFFAGSRFQQTDAVARIKQMIDEGAAIIDIGAVSSRPGADVVSPSAELERVQPICDAIASEKWHEQVLFSIDSYTPEVVEYALRSGFGLINDITGARDEAIVKLAVQYDVQLCIMHMQGTPQTMQRDPNYDDVTAEIAAFFEERIARCEALGLPREKIILDVGIGFGKTLEHNLTLIRNMAHFTSFGCDVLIGASRKSMIDMIVPAPVEERLPGTLAIHLKAIENGANIVRCHDVAEHVQAVKVWGALAP